MDDLKFGQRNKRGDFSPSAPLGIAPFYALPPNPLTVLKWLPNYLLPWNLLFLATTLLIWRFVLPPVETMKTLQPGWILGLFVVNCVLVFLFYNAFEYRLYRARAQGTRFKYNAKFPEDVPNKAFWFNSQNIEGYLRTFLTGVPIWTAYEVICLWASANGVGWWVSFADHPVWLFVLGLLVPMIHEIHFYCVHRLIHWPPLYRMVHSIHHNSVNPSPWSSLSMHWFEQLLYFSSCLIGFIIPSNPLIAMYQLNYAGFGAVVGHIGFDTIEVNETSGFDSHAYAHYLHHKYFEVNYADGLAPFDKLFGTWHDGTPEGEAKMNERFAKKQARMNKTEA